jgi:CRP-like cAMP-binding protein
MGPIMDVLRKTVRQDKYAYYNHQLEDIQVGHQRGRVRGHAVSAEVGDEDHSDYQPPRIEKPPEVLASLADTVRRCPLFSALQAKDRDVVTGALEQVTLPPGHIIYKEGAIPEDSFWYIVSSGSVRSVKEGAVVANFEPGQSFGEIELMYTTPALVTTLADSTHGAICFRLDRRTYRKIIMSVCNERRKLYRELLSGVPFAESLTEQQHSVLADALSPIHFAPGDVLIKIGEINEWMYIIVDGVVEVFGSTGEKVCDLKRGEMVGELEFLNKHAAVAHCQAKTHVHACKLHRDHFEMCLGPVTDYIKAVLRNPKYKYYAETQGKR